jgi:quinol monooxygenase YgiN
MSILVLLELEAAEGAAEEMIAVLQRSLVDTRARPGCESVTVHRDHDRPGLILLVERWASREDDTAYRAWRAGDGAVPEMAPLVAGPPRIRYYDDVDA